MTMQYTEKDRPKKNLTIVFHAEWKTVYQNIYKTGSNYLHINTTEKYLIKLTASSMQHKTLKGNQDGCELIR